jgi:gamma-tubulin complex component 3
MSKSSAERIHYVLEQLIQRTVPVYPEDDEESVERRVDEAYATATDVLNKCVPARFLWNDRFTDHLSSSDEPSVAADVHHAADLIKKRCKQYNTRAARLSLADYKLQ